MHNSSMIYGPSLDRGADLTNQLTQLKAAGCETVFREKITGTTADRPQLKKLMATLAPGDVVITPAVDRLSRDATDLLVIARDMQRAGRACVRLPSRQSIPRPILPSLSLQCWASRRSSNGDASLSARRGAVPTRRRRVSNSAASRCSHHTSSRRRGSGLQKARHSAASPGATMSVDQRLTSRTLIPHQCGMVRLSL